MQLWQLDVTASAFLTGGREVKIVTGIDDHSRFCVIAKAVLRATARPVCQAFLDAMSIYGVPEEVLSDNGTVFTGRFIKPRPAEVLFERICRENGITQRLTRPASPPRGRSSVCTSPCRTSFSMTAARSRASRRCRPLDAWRQEYNTDRPHQSLGMAFPACRFTAEQVSPQELRVPARQGLTRPDEPGPTTTAPEAAAALRAKTEPSLVALEAERIVPPSGNTLAGVRSTAPG